jgi:cytochrome P450
VSPAPIASDRTPPVAVDLSDGESFRAGFPHDHFAWLRANDPVHWHAPTARTPDGEGFWVVSRHADVMAVLRDPVVFSSDRGRGLRERGGTGIKDERSAGTMLNMTDDPQHHRLRSLVNRGFTPKAVAELEGELRRRTRLLLDAVGHQPFDAVHGFARELPAQAICIVLGIPESDRRDLLDWLDAGIEADSASIVSAEATTRLREYAAGLIADKRARPDGGIMSTIVHARLDDGSHLTDRELTAFFALLFPAGAETTRSAIAGGVLAFVEHPDEYDRLRHDPSLAVTAVEELVRWTTPSVYKRRTASRDVALAGVPIAAGDKVTIWEMSANRDEDVFEEPFRFDIGRRPNPHVGFGFGVHFCLGASLARLEMRIALEELVARFARFEPAGAYSWTPNNRLFGLTHLPVTGRPIGGAADTTTDDTTPDDTTRDDTTRDDTTPDDGGTR